MRRFLLVILSVFSLFISACSKKEPTVQIEPTAEQTVEVIELIEGE